MPAHPPGGAAGGAVQTTNLPAPALQRPGQAQARHAGEVGAAGHGDRGAPWTEGDGAAMAGRGGRRARARHLICTLAAASMTGLFSRRATLVPPPSSSMGPSTGKGRSLGPPNPISDPDMADAASLVVDNTCTHPHPRPAHPHPSHSSGSSILAAVCSYTANQRVDRRPGCQAALPRNLSAARPRPAATSSCNL